MSEDRKPTPVIGGVQIEAHQAIEISQIIDLPVGDRVLWSLGGTSSGVTMIVGGSVVEMITLAHRLLDLVAELDGVTL